VKIFFRIFIRIETFFRKYEKIIKLYRNSEKVYEIFLEKFSPERMFIFQVSRKVRAR